MKFLFVAIAVASLSGCASYSGRGLENGANRQEVQNLMGEAAARYQDPTGGEVWAYPRGPRGLHSYMVRFDGQGRMRSIEQVLQESSFAMIRIGQDRGDDVLRRLGPYWLAADFPRQKERVWTWRFRNAMAQPAQVHVTFDESSVVKRVEQVAEDQEVRRRSFE